jgi:hypothetical protein
MNLNAQPGPAMVPLLGPGFLLGVRVVMMVMATVVTAGRKYRAGKHQQKQDCCKNLFHATNVARSARQE